MSELILLPVNLVEWLHCSTEAERNAHLCGCCGKKYIRETDTDRSRREDNERAAKHLAAASPPGEGAPTATLSKEEPCLDQ